MTHHFDGTIKGMLRGGMVGFPYNVVPKEGSIPRETTKGYVVTVESDDEAEHRFFFMKLDDALKFAGLARVTLTTGFQPYATVREAGVLINASGKPPEVYLGKHVEKYLPVPTHASSQRSLWGQLRYQDNDGTFRKEEARAARIEEDNLYNHFQVWSARVLSENRQTKVTKALRKMQADNLIGKPLDEMWEGARVIFDSDDVERSWSLAYRKR